MDWTYWTKEHQDGMTKGQKNKMIKRKKGQMDKRKKGQKDKVTNRASQVFSQDNGCPYVLCLWVYKNGIHGKKEKKFTKFEVPFLAFLKPH